MKKGIFLLVFLGIACAPSAPHVHLAEGTWTGTLTPMNHPEMHTSLRYEVNRRGEAFSILIAAPDSPSIAARDIHQKGDTLAFVFNEPDANVPLTCRLAKEPAGGFAGRCTAADGKWARFTMVPPTE